MDFCVGLQKTWNLVDDDTYVVFETKTTNQVKSRQLI
jgi:hypothetical protein